MAAGSHELVSRATRRHFREYAPAIPVREIDDMWIDEGFASPAHEDESVPGVRRSRYEQYLRSVDWTDRNQVDRALRVFEVTIHGATESSMTSARMLLERDGLSLGGDGRISWVREPAVRAGALAGLRDASAIREQLERLEDAIANGDARLAIGSAKELIESTAYTVLLERGVPVPDDPKVPRLVRAAETALHLHPSQQAPGPDGTEVVRKILGALSTLAVGVAELRNAGYGTGHGRPDVPSGLGVRHAHLAVGAARVWCECMLDTLADERAPWRRSVHEAEPLS